MERERKRTLERDDDMEFISLLIAFWQAKFIIIAITGIAGVLSIVISSKITPVYEARVTLLPITAGDTSTVGFSSTIAEITGISTPQSSSNQKILTILRSRTLCEQIVNEMDLVETWQIDYETSDYNEIYNQIVRELRSSMSVMEDGNIGLIEVTVEHTNPELAAYLANKSVEILEKKLMEKSITISRKSNELLEKQIQNQKKILEELQTALIEYQRRYKVLNPQNQVQTTMGLYSGLFSKKIDIEIQISQLKSALSETNPKIASLRKQLVGIEEQMKKLEYTQEGRAGVSLTDAPDYIIEYEDILRDMEIAKGIYINLLSLSERSELITSEDDVFVEVIDPAIVPDQKSKPNRKNIVLASGIGGFVLSIILIIFVKIIKDIRMRYQMYIKEKRN